MQESTKWFRGREFANVKPSNTLKSFFYSCHLPSLAIVIAYRSSRCTSKFANERKISLVYEEVRANIICHRGWHGTFHAQHGQCSPTSQNLLSIHIYKVRILSFALPCRACCGQLLHLDIVQLDSAQPP